MRVAGRYNEAEGPHKKSSNHTVGTVVPCPHVVRTSLNKPEASNRASIVEFCQEVSESSIRHVGNDVEVRVKDLEMR
jgi:hypothetical protein